MYKLIQNKLILKIYFYISWFFLQLLHVQRILLISIINFWSAISTSAVNFLCINIMGSNCASTVPAIRITPTNISHFSIFWDIHLKLKPKKFVIVWSINPKISKFRRRKVKFFFEKKKLKKMVEKHRSGLFFCLFFWKIFPNIKRNASFANKWYTFIPSP